jgi:hypothetical protein
MGARLGAPHRPAIRRALTDPCELFEMTAFSPPSSGMPTVQVTPAEGGSNTSSY